MISLSVQKFLTPECATERVKSMAKYLIPPQNKYIYETAQILWKKCFLSDGSLFYEDPIWTLDNLQIFHEHFVIKADESKDKKFLEKLFGQIGASDKTIICLCAEILCVYYLFPSNISSQTKRSTVSTVLSWCNESIPQDHLISKAFDSGIGGTGSAYNLLQFRELAWLLDVIIAFKKISKEERDNLNGPLAFLSFVDNVPMKGNRQGRHILLHLFFPDYFERIATLRDKEAIVAAFAKYVTNPSDGIDKKLFEIRDHLEKEYQNSNLDFYNPPLCELWRPDLEIEYKIWLKTRKNDDGTQKFTEKTIYQYVRALKAFVGKRLKDAKINPSNVLLYTTIKEFSDVYSRIIAIGNYKEKNATWASGSFESSAKQYKIFLKERSEKEYEQHTQTSPQNAAQHSNYTLQHILDEGCFVDKLVLFQMFDRLCNKKNLILQGPPGTGKTWLAKRLAYALVGKKNSEQIRSMQFHATLSYEDFVCGWRPAGDGKLELLDGPFLEIVEQAKKKTGIPHVMVIEEINRGNPAQIFGEMLTLLEADKRKGDEALRLCYQKAGENRTIYIPDNLYLIGTMNVADRSLAIVDFALRRRFAFFDLKPVFGGSWQKWMCERAGLPMTVVSQIAQNMMDCNKKIAEDTALGPQYAIGHSFVTSESSIDDYQAWFNAVIETELVPLLREYWFDASANIADAVDILKKGILE